MNSVAYQAPYWNQVSGAMTYPADAFYHRYSYDAENRITLAETSADSVIWEREARYAYYLHGPLARTVLGNQLVQGMDYAYTLQGWLKRVNSTSLNSGYDMGEDGRTTGQNKYIARCPKKHLDGDQKALDEQSLYWRNNLASKVLSYTGFSNEEKSVLLESDQFRHGYNQTVHSDEIKF